MHFMFKVANLDRWVGRVIANHDEELKVEEELRLSRPTQSRKIDCRRFAVSTKRGERATLVSTVEKCERLPEQIGQCPKSQRAGSTSLFHERDTRCGTCIQ